MVLPIQVTKSGGTSDRRMCLRHRFHHTNPLVCKGLNNHPLSLKSLNLWCCCLRIQNDTDDFSVKRYLCPTYRRTSHILHFVKLGIS